MSTFDQMWADLEPVGRVTSGGYRRFAWTGVDATLGEWFAAEAARRSLDLTEDRAGNQWAWWGDPDVTPGIAIGSHLDSVPDGGAYDGPLGVVSGFAAVDALQAVGVRPNRPVGVVRFVDEEGARFGIACAGSRLITGELDADRARGLIDADGVTLGEAFRASGRDPGRLGPDPEVLRRVGTFVELHVEQGRGLLDLGRPVAAGSSIWPHGRWRIDLPGQANHAGTTRLEDRRDPTLALAEVVLSARRLAEQHGVVATCGKVRLDPNGVNAIPSHATVWLDARGADADAVRALVAELGGTLAEPGQTLVEESWTPTTAFNEPLASRLAALLDDAPLLATGAGHDAGILANAGVPTAMLFVRNPTGISHSPEEFAELDDCLLGVDALTRTVRELVA